MRGAHCEFRIEFVPWILYVHELKAIVFSFKRKFVACLFIMRQGLTM